MYMQGGVGSSSSAGNLAAMMASPPQTPGSPSPRVKVQAPSFSSSDVPRPSSASKQIRMESACTQPAAPLNSRVEPARAVTAPAASQGATQVRVQAATSQAVAPPSTAILQQPMYSMPDLPAPRSWTPSKLGTTSGENCRMVAAWWPAAAYHVAASR